jgi:AraC-like DNA-binding protein
MIIFDRGLLSLPLPMSNPIARKTYEKECQQLCLLNISPRTLRRRLTEERTSYKSLVADIRKRKALDLLQTTSVSIARIAAELGYSDLSNFYRAFKRWTGKNPNMYRKMKLRQSGNQ